MFCLPKDQTTQDKLLANAHLKNKYRFVNSLDVIFWSFFLALIVSVIYMVATQCFPKQMNQVGTWGGAVMVILYSILILVYNAEGSQQFIVAIISIVVAVLLIFTIFRYKKTL